MIRETNRWRGVGSIALLAGGVGVLAGRPALLLAAVIGVAFASYARMASAPSADVEIERTVSESSPAPGEEVSVTVTVRNAGDSWLPDLRIVDGVPDAIPVVDGSPRLGTSLRPGKRATFSYAVTARRGSHEFGPVTVLLRDFGGAVERETTVGTETTLVCTPPLVAADPVPLRTQTTQYAGLVSTDVGGTGVEFYSTREYRPGDSLNRIDWKRHARTRELTTLEFREERAATVVVVVDVREEAYRASNGDDANAVDYGVDAAGQLFAGLLDRGDRAGLAAFGPESCWLAPGTGEESRTRARRLLGTDSAFSSTPSDQSFYPTIRLRRLRRRLPADAQVILCSPLSDSFIATVARRLDAHGHAVTVVSPNVTGDETVGQRLARTERALRLSELRRVGIRAVDWNVDQPLSVALERAAGRWSR